MKKYEVVFDSILIRRYSYEIEAESESQAKMRAEERFKWGELSGEVKQYGERGHHFQLEDTKEIKS